MIKQFTAKAKHIWYSPYKLRPLADVVRGKDVSSALNWLTIYKNKRSVPVKKTLESAIANARDLEGVELKELVVSAIYIDQGPVRKYYKPGAMGRAKIQRKRQSHITVVLERKNVKG